LVFPHSGMLNQVLACHPHSRGSYAYRDPRGDSDHIDVDPKIAGEQLRWVDKCEDS